MTTSGQPRVVNLGKVTRSQVKRLKNGHGNLVREIEQIVNHEVSKLPPPAEGETYKTVVVVHERKLSKKARRRLRKKRRRNVSIMGLQMNRKQMRRSGIST